LKNTGAIVSLLGVCGLALSANAQTAFPEVEPNDTKATANGPFVMAAGDSITGLTTGSSTTTPGAGSADNFIVKTTPAALDIYRHRLVITTTGAVGHVGTIRGLTQTAGVPNISSDAAVQTSSTTTTPTRFVQWYGFGKEEQIYFRTTGVAATTADYAATLETAPVTVVDAGTYFAGSITITRAAGVTTDTDFWVYDSNFNAIAQYGIDDPDTMTRTYAPGTYYVAYTNANFANNQPAAPGETFLTGNVLDFADAAVNSSTTAVPTLGIRLQDDYGPVDVATPKSAAYDIVWVKFEVTSTPPATQGGCCLPNMTCTTTRGATSCGLLLGTYQGDNSLCASITCPLPGACCLPNFVCNVFSQGECLAAGGTFQGPSSVCGSCPSPGATAVAIVAADAAATIADVQAKLAGTGLFSNVVIRNIQTPTPTPTLADLQQFKAVIIFSNQSFSDGAALGNVMADYVDAGGGVVNAVFSVSTATANRFLAGDWDASYQIIVQNGGNTSAGGERTIGTVLVPGHPILEGVNTFSGGTSSFRPTTTTLTAHGQLIARWSDAVPENGKVLIATSSTRPNRVDLGMFPASTTAVTTGWNATTDGARLMANALLYAGGLLTEPCYADCDGVGGLTANDFACFLSAYTNNESYANCDGVGGLTANDFVCFLTSYNAGCS
jgi:hypothetical protein